MITRDGHRCSRAPVPGGLGFCWQHVPVESEADREKWKVGIEGAALAVASADLLLKIVELVVAHAHGIIGNIEGYVGWFSREEVITPRVPLSKEAHILAELAHEARITARRPKLFYVDDLECRFNEWFECLSDDQRKLLLEEIEGTSE